MSSSVIAIDGPVASGKSTAARLLATRLNIPYINTGSMYRAIGWKVSRLGLDMEDEAALQKMLEKTEILYTAPAPGENPDIRIDGVFPGQALRALDIANLASKVAMIPFVRAYTLDIQRKTAQSQLVVMEGRDIGTVIFPDAKYKFFVTASPRVRAMRRLAQAGETADNATVESVAADIAARDKQDSTRATAPLKQAEDAVLIDTSDLTIDEVIDAMITVIRAKDSAE